MELLETIGIIALGLWGIGFIFKIGGKILKFLFIIGLILFVIGFIS